MKKDMPILIYEYLSKDLPISYSYNHTFKSILSYYKGQYQCRKKDNVLKAVIKLYINSNLQRLYGTYKYYKSILLYKLTTNGKYLRSAYIYSKKHKHNELNKLGFSKLYFKL